MPKNKLGFTLMEMLVTVLLIGILSAIGFPQYIRVVEKQRANEAVSTLSSIAKAEERYYAINDDYCNDYSYLDVELADKDKRKATGETLDTLYFVFSLKVTEEDPKITATRNNREYTITRKLNTGDVCCQATTDDEYLCDQLDLDTCEAQ